MNHESNSENRSDERLHRDLLGIREMALYDPGDLRAHPAEAYAVLEAGLSSEAHYYPTTETIFGVIALVTQDELWRAWFDPVADLVERHPIATGNQYQAGFREVVADFRPLVGVYGRLDEVRPYVISDLLAAYLKLFKVLIFRHGMSIQHQLIEQADKVSRKLDDHIERDKLYQTLALYYTHYGDTQSAKQYGQLAMNDSIHIDDRPGTLDSTMTLAIIHRGAYEFKRAGYYLNQAMDMAEGQKADKLLATLFYEYAVHCYRGDRFELALSYYARALSIFEEYEAQHQITMTLHGIVMTYIYMHDFDRVETLLLYVRRTWERLGNQYDYVNTFFVEAEFEIERGSRSLGLRLLDETEALAKRTLDNTPARERIIELIHNYRDEQMASAHS